MNTYKARPHHQAPERIFSTLFEAQTWLNLQGGGILQKQVFVPLAFPIDRVISQSTWVNLQ